MSTTENSKFAIPMRPISPDFGKLELLVEPFQKMSDVGRLGLVRSIREDRLVNKLRQKQLQALASELGALSDDERRKIIG